MRLASSVRIALRMKKIICYRSWRGRRLERTTSIITARHYTGLITALGERAADSLLTMEELYQSRAVLLVGNDPTNQNPLAGWQIRSGIRHFATKLFIINANEIKLKRKAAQFVKVEAGQEAAALRWLAHQEGQLSPELVEQLVQLKAGLEAES